MAERNLVRTTWCKDAGASESTLRWFLSGRTKSMNDITYRKLAAQQNVPVARLRGEKPTVLETSEVPVLSYVGAGAEVIPVAGDGPVDHVDVPVGLEKVTSGGYRVRGDSMMPMFADGDVLFPEQHPSPPERRIGSVVIADLGDGRRLVKKLLRGSKPGRWNLLSVNPSEPAFEDQIVLRVAGLPWIKRKI
ncbi:MAG: S24/S26 family peptidase [Reyranella sp.]|uniref:S24 family peptidase n=1 Tax=Reyranella sp. TaxID=1929291 RepID=UPI0025E76233|nr:S24 family peptidase [Reyranella sp.]MBR2813449.1 S24/S26 family peptidase [Reyranella sp.]